MVLPCVCWLVVKPNVSRTPSSAMGGPVRLKSGAAPAVAPLGALMARGRVRKAASTSWRVSPETKTSLLGWLVGFGGWVRVGVCYMGF